MKPLKRSWEGSSGAWTGRRRAWTREAFLDSTGGAPSILEGFGAPQEPRRRMTHSQVHLTCGASRRRPGFCWWGWRLEPQGCKAGLVDRATASWMAGRGGVDVGAAR